MKNLTKLILGSSLLIASASASAWSFGSDDFGWGNDYYDGPYNNRWGGAPWSGNRWGGGPWSGNRWGGGPWDWDNGPWDSGPWDSGPWGRGNNWSSPWNWGDNRNYRGYRNPYRGGYGRGPYGGGFNQYPPVPPAPPAPNMPEAPEVKITPAQ